MRTNNTRSLTAVAVCTVVVACGGGGGGGSNPSAPQQKLQSAQAPLQPLSISSTTLVGTDTSGNSWSATYSAAPSGTGTFNGQNGRTSAIALTISKNSMVVATVDRTEYYLTSPYAPLGSSGKTNGVPWDAFITSYTPLPSMLTVGGSGPVLTLDYTDAAHKRIGSVFENYTVSASTSTALLLNINAGPVTTSDAVVIDTLTYAISSGGTLLGLQQAQIRVHDTTIMLSPGWDY